MRRIVIVVLLAGLMVGVPAAADATTPTRPAVTVGAAPTTPHHAPLCAGMTKHRCAKWLQATARMRRLRAQHAAPRPSLFVGSPVQFPDGRLCRVTDLAGTITCP